MWWLVAFIVAVSASNWPDASSAIDSASRAQRDISMDIPLNHLTSLGLSINNIIFNHEGYQTAALSNLDQVLRDGINILMLDVYWNEYTLSWQLCPAPIPLDLTSNLTELVSITWDHRQYQCQPNFGISNVLDTISKFLSGTNLDFNANVLQLVLSLKTIRQKPFEGSPSAPSTVMLNNSTTMLSNNSLLHPSPRPRVSYLDVGNLTLASPLSLLGGFLYAPSDLNKNTHINTTSNYGKDFPTQHDFLFNLYKRAIVVATRGDLNEQLPPSRTYNYSSQDENSIFFIKDGFSWLRPHSNQTLRECFDRLTHNYSADYYSRFAAISDFTGVADSEEYPLTNATALQYLQCGVSAILNSTKYSFNTFQNSNEPFVGKVIDKFAPSSFWSWAPDPPSFLNFSNNTREFSSENPNEDPSDSDNDEDEWFRPSTSRLAFNCVVMTTNGWKVGNCYDKFRLACKSKTNQFDWVVSDNVHAYVEAGDNDCPHQYSFGLPRLSAEQMALHSFLLTYNITYPIWVDLNDITVSGCYVSGGPYAACPYKKIVSTRNLIRLIAPSAVVAFVILMVIFYERTMLTTPIHTNRRRHWKRAINQYYKDNDYEGVPS